MMIIFFPQKKHLDKLSRSKDLEREYLFYTTFFDERCMLLDSSRFVYKAEGLTRTNFKDFFSLLTGSQNIIVHQFYKSLPWVILFSTFSKSVFVRAGFSISSYAKYKHRYIYTFIFLYEVMVRIFSKKVLTAEKLPEIFPIKNTVYIDRNFALKNEDFDLNIDRSYDWVFAGRFVDQKQISLISQLSFVSAGKSLIVGSSETDNLAFGAKTKNLGRLSGDKYFSALRSARVGILVSLWEGNSKTVVDFIQSGVFPIVSNIPQNLIFKNQGFHIKYVPTNITPSELSNVIEDLLSDINTLESLCKANLDLADSLYFSERAKSRFKIHIN